MRLIAGHLAWRLSLIDGCNQKFPEQLVEMRIHRVVAFVLRPALRKETNAYAPRNGMRLVFGAAGFVFQFTAHETLRSLPEPLVDEAFEPGQAEKALEHAGQDGPGHDCPD